MYNYSATTPQNAYQQKELRNRLGPADLLECRCFAVTSAIAGVNRSIIVGLYLSAQPAGKKPSNQSL